MRQSKWIVVSILLLAVLPACGQRIKESALSDMALPAEKQLVRTPRVALVLGGGGNRGAAHAGVIQVLAEAGIPIDLLVGTSAGSLAAVMYADDPKHPNKLVERATAVHNKDIIDFSAFHMFSDPINGDRLQQYLENLLQAKNFSDLKIKTVAVTTDLENVTSFPIASGPIAPAVNASCAVPKVFRPLRLYGHVLVDGGMAATVPVAIAQRYHPKLIIAVNVSPHALEPGRKDSFAENLGAQKAAIAQADVHIMPDVGDFKAFSDKHNLELVEAGRNAAQDKLDDIKKLLAEKDIAMKPVLREDWYVVKHPSH